VIDAERLAERIAVFAAELCGTLRFWGQWFGRPSDNWHQLIDCAADADVLECHFHEDEVLTVWTPRCAVVERRKFVMAGADRVRWEWFYYGRPKLEMNRYFMNFTKTAVGIDTKTNVDWYTPELRPTSEQPAFELHMS
jgi:hypothetical protein